MSAVHLSSSDLEQHRREHFNSVLELNPMQTSCSRGVLWWRLVTSHVDGTRTVETSWIAKLNVSSLLNCISMYYIIMITIDSLWERRPPVTLKERWLAAGAFIGWKWTGRGHSWSNWRSGDGATAREREIGTDPRGIWAFCLERLRKQQLCI